MALIYAVKLVDEYDRAVFKQALEGLPADVRNKAARYRKEADAVRKIVSAVLKRIVACQVNGIGLHRVEFLRDGYGKPSLKEFPDFHFNVSHSHAWVVCVVSAEGPVGIDIEMIGKAEEGVARMCLTPKELHEWIGQPKEQRDTYFFKLWTLKESYVKATGKGLAENLSSLETIKEGESFRMARQGLVDTDRFLRMVSFDPAYQMAICTAVQDVPINRVDMSMNELMLGFIGLQSGSR